jgi:hypothetical protein
MIFTKYEISPHFLDTFGSKSKTPDIGGIDVGVRTELLFSETDPNEIRAYRMLEASSTYLTLTSGSLELWYKLPFRRGGPTPKILSDAMISPWNEGPFMGLILPKLRHAIARAEIRTYMTYNHRQRSSTTLLYTPHADRYFKPAVRESFSS